jgi:hypothetical protein
MRRYPLALAVNGAVVLALSSCTYLPTDTAVNAGVVGRGTWQIGPSFGLSASFGIRCTACPAYVDFTRFSYNSLDLPLSLELRWSLG